MKRTSWITFLIFLLLSVGGGLAIGANNIPGPWYQALVKPAFTPPNWLFAPAWTLLYIFIAIAGAVVWQSSEKKTLVPLWGLQMALNFVWSPIFFTLQNLALALGVIAVLSLVILGFIGVARKKIPVAAALFIPYALWVGFACYLNAGLLLLN